MGHPIRNGVFCGGLPGHWRSESILSSPCKRSQMFELLSTCLSACCIIVWSTRVILADAPQLTTVLFPNRYALSPRRGAFFTFQIYETVRILETRQSGQQEIWYNLGRTITNNHRTAFALILSCCVHITTYFGSSMLHPLISIASVVSLIPVMRSPKMRMKEVVLGVSGFQVSENLSLHTFFSCRMLCQHRFVAGYRIGTHGSS